MARPNPISSPLKYWFDITAEDKTQCNTHKYSIKMTPTTFRKPQEEKNGIMTSLVSVLCASKWFHKVLSSEGTRAFAGLFQLSHRAWNHYLPRTNWIKCVLCAVRSCTITWFMLRAHSVRSPLIVASNGMSQRKIEMWLLFSAKSTFSFAKAIFVDLIQIYLHCDFHNRPRFSWSRGCSHFAECEKSRFLLERTESERERFRRLNELTFRITIRFRWGFN